MYYPNYLYQDLEDIHNSIFLSLIDDDYKKIRQYKGINGCTVSSWIMIISTNTTLNLMKKRNKPDTSIDDSSEENKAIIDTVADPQPSVIEQIAESEQAELLEKLMEGLNPNDRLFLKYYYEDELPPEEIAEIMNLSVSAIYSKKSRIIDKLQKITKKKKILQTKGKQMDNYDKILKTLFKKASEGKKEAPNVHSISAQDCLSEELFAAYLGNLLENAEKEKVEEHLSICKTCRQNSIIYSKVMESAENEALLKTPSKITERAKQLVRGFPEKDLMEVVLEFAKDSIRVLKDTAHMLRPTELALAGTRERNKEEVKNLVFLGKKFNELNADIIIEKINDISCNIEIKTSAISSGAPLDDIRLNLISGEKELASYLTVKGGAFFKNLNFDTYTLEIIKGKDIIGEILLQLGSV